MQRSEEHIYRDRCILKILLKERQVRSARLREHFDISKATLSDCLKRLRNQTVFDILADKNGIVHLKGDEVKIKEYLAVCEHEPSGIHRVTEWMILFILRAEERSLTFTELYEAVCDFFGIFISDSSFRKRLKHLENVVRVINTRVIKENNTYIYSLANNAPVFTFLPKQEISAKKRTLREILEMYDGGKNI